MTTRIDTKPILAWETISTTKEKLEFSPIKLANVNHERFIRNITIYFIVRTQHLFRIHQNTIDDFNVDQWFSNRYPFDISGDENVFLAEILLIYTRNPPLREQISSASSAILCYSIEDGENRNDLAPFHHHLCEILESFDLEFFCQVQYALDPKERQNSLKILQAIGR